MSEARPRFMGARICVTGMGVCSAIGNNLGEFAASLRSGTSGVREWPEVFSEQTIWAGLASISESVPPGVDRAAVLADHAARDAWSQAMSGCGKPDPARVALVLGTSHGGRSQIDRCLESQAELEGSEAAYRILKVSPHFAQTEWVASQLGIHGPVSTLSTACSSGSAAIAHGMDLLHAGKADFVLAGGMDGFSKLTHAGFGALGALAEGACGPFSERIGISLGEGAAVVMLERLEEAQTRKARIWAEIYSAGSSWDCYHLTEPHPSGEGLVRALSMAAARAGLEDGHEFGYASLHGTGTRANDAAETIAVKRFFHQAIPPASSLKSLTGHTLGASGAMGFIASVLGMEGGFLPPTVNFDGARAGCDLDYVANKSRAAEIACFAAQSAGFGGVNLALMGGALRKSKARTTSDSPASGSSIAISGMGVVSPIGIGLGAFREGLLNEKSGIGAIDRFKVANSAARHAGMVRDFFPRKLAPTLNLRRADLCFQFAAVAVAEALENSRLPARGVAPERIGLVAGTTRGAVASFERCMQSAVGGAWGNTSAVAFPNLVMSSLGGYVSNMFQFKGAASTLVCGSGDGLQAVIHGFEMLRCNPTQDAIVVVLADELSPLFYRYFDDAGFLGGSAAQGGTAGRIMGEGAAAFVLERSHTLQGRDDDCAHFLGYGMTTDSDPEGGVDSHGLWYGESIREAICDAALAPSEVDLIFGHGTGRRCGDTREMTALARVFDRKTPLCCVLPNTGFSESASGGFSLAAAALAMRNQETYGLGGGKGDVPWNIVRNSASSAARIENVLIAASSDSGNNSALLLGRRSSEAQGQTVCQ